jgi:aminopeptidase N
MYFNLVDRGIDYPIGALQPLPGHRDVAYTKGFLVFHMLARKVGRETFRRALRDIADAHAAQPLEWWRFLQELERRSGVDLAKFYDQWLHRTGAPSWSERWRNIEGGVEVTIQQTSPVYELEMPVRITLESGSIVDTMVVADAEETTLIIPLTGRATQVSIDPDYHILRRVTDKARDHAGRSGPLRISPNLRCRAF